MPRRTTLTTLAATALFAVAIAACSGAAAGGPGVTPAPASPVPASPVPATPVPATPVPVPATPDPAPATPSPTETPVDGMPIKVDLDNVTGHDVYVDIVDRSGRIVRATSGTPGDGASVPPYTIKVENVDDSTIRLTWSDLPGDNALALYVDEAGTGMILVQPEHDGDSVAFDRILVLEFDGPVSADDLQVSIQDGLDTPG